MHTIKLPTVMILSNGHHNKALMADEFMDGNRLTQEELEHLAKRRRDLQSYEPPVWESAENDPVSGEKIRVPMTMRANLAFFGPVGSGKSSLIGSMCRSVNGTSEFPMSVEQTLHHPEDVHGTLHWRETAGNQYETLIYQDTRGDQLVVASRVINTPWSKHDMFTNTAQVLKAYDDVERSVHDMAVRGFYRDGAPMGRFHAFCEHFWKQRFFWERTLNDIPHCVVFVFDGSTEPFLKGEGLKFFKNVFKDFVAHGYEPVIVITCLDVLYKDCREGGRNFHVEKDRKVDKILAEFEHLDLTKQNVYFVANFHDGRRGIRLWDENDDGFEKANKIFVDLAKDLKNIANKFIKQHYGKTRHCCLL